MYVDCFDKLEKLPRDWDEFVAGREDGGPYHTTAWLRALCRTYPYRPYALMVAGRGEIQGVLPLIAFKNWRGRTYLISLPGASYCGPLARDEKTRDLLINEAQSLARGLKADHLELRGLRQERDMPGHTRLCLMVCQRAKALDYWQRPKDSAERNYGRAEGAGVDIRVGSPHAADLAAFAVLYQKSMRYLGSPAVGEDFFVNLKPGFGATMQMCGAYYANQLVAAAIILVHAARAHARFIAADPFYRRLRVNDYLYHEMRALGREKEWRSLDLGRTAHGSGAFRFKANWGATPAQLYYSYYLPKGGRVPFVHPSATRYKMAGHIWRWLPPILTENLGPRIVHNFL